MNKTDVVITGVGLVPPSRRSGRSPSSMACEATAVAARDASIDPRDIDAVVPCLSGAMAEDVMSGFGLGGNVLTAAVPMGGASSVAAIGVARTLVLSGAATHVLVVLGRNGSSGPRVAGRMAQLPGASFRMGLERPIGLMTPAQWYALLAQRHMHEFGTTKAQLGSVALAMRAHANRTPGAQMHAKPLTMDDYLAGRPITDPFGLFDCCLESDGAAAVIVQAADGDESGRAVRVLAATQGRPGQADDLVGREDFLCSGVRHAAKHAFEQAGCRPSDLDFAMVYDCFTFEVIHQLEELGVCGEGEGGEFVEGGRIGPDGAFPVNPHGGLLSHGHLGGLSHVVEAVIQLRGEAENRQVPKAELCAVTGWGDLGDGSVAILAKD